jgi:hypothetical protein
VLEFSIAALVREILKTILTVLIIVLDEQFDHEAISISTSEADTLERWTGSLLEDGL